MVCMGMSDIEVRRLDFRHGQVGLDEDCCIDFVLFTCYCPRPNVVFATSGPEDDGDASSVAHSEASLLVRMTGLPALTSDVREPEGVSSRFSSSSVSGEGTSCSMGGISRCSRNPISIVIRHRGRAVHAHAV